MTGSLAELLPSVLELLVYGVGSVVLSAVGVYIEEFALTAVDGGQLSLGLWTAVVGFVAIYAGYLLATDKFGPKFFDLRAAMSDSP